MGGTDLCSQNRAEREQEREAPPSWGWLQPCPTSARRRKKLLPSVCITGRRQREDAGGRGVTIGIPKPDLAECRVNSTPPRSCPNVPQSHTDFEVLNTARHTSPKMGRGGVNLDWQRQEGILWVPQLAERSPRKAFGPPLDQTVL